MYPLISLLLIWCCVYIAIIFAQKTRLTPVLYFLFLGSLMVNTGILPHETDPFIEGFSEIGIILIMFALGFEECSTKFVKSMKRSWGIAFFGAVAPFFTAFFLALVFWEDINVAIICGLAMTATAVSLTMVSLKSEGLNTSRAATGIMTSAILDDIASLALLAILVPIAAGEGVIDPLHILMIVGKTIAFFVFVVAVAKYALPHIMPQWFERVPVIGKYGMRHLLEFGRGEHATLTVLIMALGMGLLAHYMGFHPAVGAYMAGLIMKEEYFNFQCAAGTNHYERTKTIIENVAFSWIGPVFFVYLGTQIVFDWDVFVSVIPKTIILVLSLFVAQVLSAALAARYTAGFSSVESLMIGFGMLGRAELAFVVMSIAYLEKSIISTEVFYTLMFTAFWLNVSVPVTISFWKPYFTGQKTMPGFGNDRK
ncbi:MAG: cation:proton antiporter [Rhodospirillales bacterium]|nr:cation:proton antiporter [Rhodospirillales bacterium]